MGKQDSKFDHLRPRIDVTEFTPYYEDRVMVRRIAHPVTDGSLYLPEKRNTIGEGDYDLVELQLGEVVALGPGSSGIWKDGEIRGHGEHAQQQPGYPKAFKSGGRLPFQVKIGDKVLYHRVHTNEVVHEGETYTLLFEEQNILAVVEQSQSEVFREVNEMMDAWAKT